VSRDQFLTTKLLLFVALFVVLPAYGLYTGKIGVLWTALWLGGVLFVWKWRWWWEPIRNRVGPDPEQQ
jgi:hypothetical protein